jgi:hypothetical protein
MDGCLNEDLIEGVDFDCVPEVAWDWLIHLYVLAAIKSSWLIYLLNSDMARLNKVLSKEKSSLVAFMARPP